MPSDDRPTITQTSSAARWQRQRPAWQWVVGIGALVLFGSLLMIRGPLANPAPVADFVHFYAATRAWLHGENSYQHEVLQRVMDDAPQSPDRTYTRSELIALYPPATYPLVSPFAALPYRLAALAWTALNVALVPVLIVLTARLAEVRLRSFDGLVLAVGVLALAPLQTTFRTGQMAIMVTVLVLAGLVLMRRDRDGFGGLALGLAAALKPQVGLVFLAYAIIRRRWWSAGTALAALTLCQALGMAVLTTQGHDWWSGLRANLHFFAHGGPGDPTRASPNAWQLINLHHPLHLLVDSRTTVQLIVLIAVGCLGLLAWRWATPARTAGRELLFLALIAVLTLLVAYHRIYDAVLLVIPLAWLVRSGWRLRPVCSTAVILLLPFIVSGPAALQQASANGWIPSAVETSTLWATVILPHQVWALAALALLFAGALAATREDAQAGVARRTGG